MASTGGAPPAAGAAAGPSTGPAVLDVATVEANMHRHESRIVPQLQNVVATVNLGAKLDLKQIATNARNAEYNPKRFAAVIMRIREPKTTALIFASGKMVCTGAKSEEDSRAASRRYAKIVQKLGFPVVFTEFKIQNIVGSCDVRFPIRLEGLACSHSLFASYEPELFPGLIYRMKQPKIVLLIFVSGKVVLTGAKTRAEIYQAFMNIYPTLVQFKKGDAGLPALLPPMPSAAMPPPRALPPAPTTMAPPPPAAPTPQPMQAPTPQPSTGPPAFNLPPPTPLHHGNLPPPTPMHTSLQPAPSWVAAHLPPPTPSHH